MTLKNNIMMMIRWQEHCQNGVTDRRTDGQTDRQTEIAVLRAAWSQLKRCDRRADWRTEGRTDRRTDWTIHRAAWSQLKTIGHLYYATSSSMHHFIAIGEFKLELQSGNAQFGSKSMIFFSLVTLQFDVWPWKTIGHLFYATSSFVQHFVAIGDFKLELQSGKAQFGSNSIIFRAGWPWNLTDDLEKQ